MEEPCAAISFALSPHTAHQTGHFLLWDGLPFLNEDMWYDSQCGSVGHSKTYSTPQMFNWVEVWTHSRLFHPLHFQILEVLFDDLRSVVASVVILEDGIRCHVLEVWNCHWLHNVITIPHCGEVSFDY